MDWIEQEKSDWRERGKSPVLQGLHTGKGEYYTGFARALSLVSADVQ